MTFRDISVLDYLLTTIDSYKLLNELKVVDLDRLFSDGHSLLEYTIKTKQQKDCKITHDKKVSNWDDRFSNTFVSNISDSCIKDIMSKLSLCRDNVSQENVNSVSDLLNDVFLNSASKSFPIKKTKPNVNNFKKNKPWYGIHCKKG